MTAPRHHNRLLVRFDYARARLDRGVDLLQQALELRELLGWGVVDLDDAVERVREFKRAAAIYRQEAS